MKILLGFRKLFVILLSIFISTIFIITGHIDGKTFGDILKGIVVAYSMANIGEHVTDLLKNIYSNTNKDK